MNRIRLAASYFAILPAMIIFMVLIMYAFANGESYILAAPNTFQSIKLNPEERSYYGSSPFSNFSLTTEGWACSERFADTTIRKIREINMTIRPLAEAQQSLTTLEKALIQMAKDKVITLTKSNVENIVYRTISQTGISSERDILQKADELIKNTMEEGKNINRVFGYYRDEDLFTHVDYGVPSSIWKVSKMEPDEPSTVVFVAQNCYKKQDLEAMVNAIISAAQKLEEVKKSYIETRDKVLALGK